MNERIRKLAEQAGALLSPGYNVEYTVKHVDSDVLAKFAELIVKECMEVARQTVLSGSGVDPDKFIGTVTTVQQIKRHFGVEE